MAKIKVRGTIIGNDMKWIYDWFEIENTSPKDIENQIEAAGDEDLEVEINSGGGDVYAGSEIYTRLKEQKKNVTTKIYGLAASAASVIAMAGNKVSISPAAQIMIHNVSGGAKGDYREMDHTSDVLKGWNKSIANPYMIKTGMSQEELLRLMNKETWLTAQDAVKYGFADEVMFDDELKLTAVTGVGIIPQEVINKMRNMLLSNGNFVNSNALFLEKENGKELIGKINKEVKTEGTSDQMLKTISDAVTKTLQNNNINAQTSTEEPRQVPVDLYNKLYADLERRANL